MRDTAWQKLALLIGVAVLVALPSVVVAEQPECLPLRQLQYVASAEERRHDLQQEEIYFCSPTAPIQFRCSCPAANVCKDFGSADGRDFGRCECCPPWVYGVLGTLLFLFFLSLMFCTYSCFCRGKWWCDGYHPAIQAYAPQRSRPMVIPAGVALPNNLFRGYRSSDFDSGAVNEELAAAAGAAARQHNARQRGAANATEQAPLVAEGGAAAAAADDDDDADEPVVARPDAAGTGNASTGGPLVAAAAVPVELVRPPDAMEARSIDPDEIEMTEVRGPPEAAAAEADDPVTPGE